MSWGEGVRAVYAKDIRSEARPRSAMGTLGLFAVVTLVVVSFAIPASELRPELHASLFWIILFFASMAGLSRSFVAEAERGTDLALRFAGAPSQILAGKFLFNLTLLWSLMAVLLPLFQIFLPFPRVEWGLLVAGLALGAVGLAASTTLIAAIVSQSGVRGALFTVLSFPVLVPQLVAGIGVSRKALLGKGFGDSLPEFQLLVAYAGVMLILGWLLADHLWRD